MPHTSIDISSLKLYDKEGRLVDLQQYTDSDGKTYLKGKSYFQPLSVSLFDNDNFYLLKKKTSTAKYYGGDIFSSTDVIDRYFIYNVSFPNNLVAGQEIRELSSTSVPTPHIDYDSNPNHVGWSPVFVAELDSELSRIKMSKPALAAGPADFETVSEQYVFPGENLGDQFIFRWVKREKGLTMQGWPYLNDEAHYVGEYRIYKNKLYKCVTAYVGPYVGNSAMWREVSVNKDDYGFFVYDVLVDQQNSPYIEKVVEKKITYSSDHVGFKYPMEFNVAFSPAQELAYENALEIYYKYADTGEEVKIIELTMYGEGVMEDERLAVWLTNFGIKFNRYDAMVIKDYNLKEALPDWNVINDAMKQMFFNKEQVFPYIGTYKGLSNLIAILGFKDILHVKEYWINKNPQSVYFNRMLLVDISDTLDNGKIDNMSMLEFNRTVKFDDAMRKTGFLALSYEFTAETGEYDADGIPIVEETSDMTPSEVFYKLYRLKDKLKAEFLPVNVVIKDIIGEFVYFQRVTPKYWYDQTKIFQNEIAEDADISLFPKGFLYVQSVETLYEQRHNTGAPFPRYTFNYGGSDPYESGQRYQYQRMAGLVSAIETYYAEIARHDSYSLTNDYYWEYGDDAETPIGCPTILSFDVRKLTIGDTIGKKLSDFVIGGAESYSQPYFSAVEHQRSASPLYNQWSEVTINSPVVYGHIYSHNIDINGDIHQYTYTAGVTVSVTADGALTNIEINDGTTSATYTYPGSSLMPRVDIAGYMVGQINVGGQAIVATDNFDGTLRILSSSTNPFTVNPVDNCTTIGDTAADVAAGMAAAILAEMSPVAINAWMPSPASSTYYVQAVNYDDQYVNMFEAVSSYYTLENVDYLNMYEIEWSIRRIGGDQPYQFTWRGLLKDLHRIPHVFPYAGDYDVSARVYDFMGGATMVYKPKLVTVVDRQPEIMVLSKYEDKFNYQMSNLKDAMLQDCGNSEMYDPNILMRNSALAVGNLKISLLDWDFYRRNMYTYDISADNGIMLWDISMENPEYVPWYACNHPLKGDWGVNPQFCLTSADFPGARLEDLYFWKLKNTVFNADFLAGFHMWNPAPFDKIVFGKNIGSPYTYKIEYVCPQVIVAACASVSNISTANVNTIDGYTLAAGDVVLLKMQSDENENGVYTAVDMGGYFSLSRDSRCNTAYKTANSFVAVLDGSVNGSTAWRTLNYLTNTSDTFASSPMQYYQCPFSLNYVQGSPFDYLAALNDIICSEQHFIMSMFYSHVILYSGYGGSPETRMLHITAREFDKYAYQYLSYVKNADTSLYPVIPMEVITGSEYTFYEPHWAYSDALLTSLEAEYPNFKRQEMFLFAPIMDILNGNTNDIDYFTAANFLTVADGKQVGHLPTVLDENYLAINRTKAFPDGFFIPKHSLMFFAINNLFAKREFEWVLTNDVTGEELVRAKGAPFFVWKFNHNSSYRLTASIQDKGGNKYEKQLTNFVHVDPGIQYKTTNEVLNTRRRDDLVRQGLMYGAAPVAPPPTPLEPPVVVEEGIEFWYVEYDLVPS